MSKEKHIHAFDMPVIEKVRLSKHEVIEGRDFETTTGYDLLRERKCKCGAKYAYDLERKLHGQV